MNRYTLGGDGYFRKDGERFVPVGANYWPGSCGVEVWRDWPAGEIRADLDLMGRLGLNTIRFFLRWQDFEPEPGVYCETAFARLREWLGWCRERGIAAHPSLFVGFMSGGLFWPAWRGERNVFADEQMCRRGFAFARKAAEVIAEFRDCVLAIDQGNELCCLPDTKTASPAAVSAWCRGVNDAVREVWPDAILISGNEQNQVVSDTGFRLGDQPGCDLYSMHGYPVPAWHPVSFDGMTDPLAQSLLPFYTSVARAFGPVMVQEFGTILTSGRTQQESYLKGMLEGCWQAGGNGFLWWCLRDVRLEGYPYHRHSFERSLGLVDRDGVLKPGLETFIDFCRTLSTRETPQADEADEAADREVGVYFPRHPYHRDAPENPGNTPWENAARMIISNYLLQKIGKRTRVIRGDRLEIPSRLRTLVISGVMLDLAEIDAVARWVREGGRLIWHGVDSFMACDRLHDLLGAAAVDFRAPKRGTFHAFGKDWAIGQCPRRIRAEFEPRGARVIASDTQGVPMVLTHDVGQGRVVWTVPMIESAAVDVSADRDARDAWADWFRAVLAA